MTGSYAYFERLDLLVTGRITPEDARRQERTAREILRRLREQPGLVLADEVGMGKTFVALAVAVSVALADPERRPVVVMVPPSLRDKWPKDFDLFRERCLPPAVSESLRCGVAERSVQFLKLLDDPPERRKSLLFVTHGAMSRALFDKWTKLALIYYAIKGRHGVDDKRRALSRYMPDILKMRSMADWGAEVWHRLLSTDPSNWLAVLQRLGIDPDGNDAPESADDPVPDAVLDVLPRVALDALWQALDRLPQRRGKLYDQHIKALRRDINRLLQNDIWPAILSDLRLALPLLILDEAHHLKNEDTRLASLFRAAASRDDADAVTRGPLAHAFERMLFLTATPFQLGHAELCSVLDRFDGVAWADPGCAGLDRGRYRQQIEKLRDALDAAQVAALRLETAWGQLTAEDMVVDGVVYEDCEAWWGALPTAKTRTDAVGRVLARYDETRDRMAAAGACLRPWVIRHLRQKELVRGGGDREAVPRRRRLVGRAIVDTLTDSSAGLPVAGPALLPFLLAARATTSAPEARPVFAEGLASSYEAFLHTRGASKFGTGKFLDDDDDPQPGAPDPTDAQQWYLDCLEELVQGYQGRSDVPHPKVDATVHRVVELWRQGEKVVVFCHYVATGKALRQRISEAIAGDIRLKGARQLGMPADQVEEALQTLGDRFFDVDSPLRRAADAELDQVLGQFPALAGDAERLVAVIRRYLRTPSFLVRFGVAGTSELDAEAIDSAMTAVDGSGMSLRAVVLDFCRFLTERCSRVERERYIEALERLQTGSHVGADVEQTFSPDEVGGERTEQLLPNVRLVNGAVRQETRQRLMLTFNTPFYPEVLIASNVLAEGVDLHLNCRYVIHHDLCWNPSTLEQRTGRIDRIGAKCERSRQPVNMFLPFIAETQDEKMYRVVTDRERWFNVVMGEGYDADVRNTDRIAARIPFPEAAAEGLVLSLAIC